MMNQIKQKLILSIVGIFVILLFIIMTILYIILNKAFYVTGQNTAFSITNSIYIAMNEVVFDGANITAFIAKDPFIQAHFFESSESEADHQDILVDYLNNVTSIYNYESVYIASFGTNKCYSKNGISQVFDKNKLQDQWFFDKTSTLDVNTPYESLLIEDPLGHTNFFMTYVISNQDNKPLGLVLLGIDYLKTFNTISNNAENLNASIYLIDQSGKIDHNFSTNTTQLIEPISVKHWVQDGDFHFIENNRSFVSYKYIHEMNQYIVIVQQLSTYMQTTFLLAFIIVLLISLILVLVMMRIFTNSSHKLLHHASLDTLTGLLNRGSYNHKIIDALELASKYAITSSLIFIDIDHFKSINDTKGHDFGDDIIKSVAELLKNSKRSDDYLFRWGGDEFAILARCPIDHALSLSQRILEASQTIHWQDNTPITLSIGVSEILPSDNKKDCFNRADQALYHAKEQGRNQICYI